MDDLGLLLSFGRLALPDFPAKQAGVVLRAFFSSMYCKNNGSYCLLETADNCGCRMVLFLGIDSQKNMTCFAESASFLSSLSY